MLPGTHVVPHIEIDYNIMGAATKYRHTILMCCNYYIHKNLLLLINEYMHRFCDEKSDVDLYFNQLFYQK